MHETSIDLFDLRILDALQRDGRLTNAELAGLVGLSASQCSRRRSALEETGIIRSYHAHLSPEALGLNLLAFVQIRFSSHSDKNDLLLETDIESLPNVISAYSLIGKWDYMLQIVAKNLQEIEGIINRGFLSRPHIAQIQTTIALKPLKQTFNLPLTGHPSA